MPQLPHRKFCLAFKRQTKLKIKVIRKEKFAHRIWSKHEKQLFCGRNSLEREKTAAVVLTSNKKKQKSTNARPLARPSRAREGGRPGAGCGLDSMYWEVYVCARARVDDRWQEFGARREKEKKSMVKKIESLYFLTWLQSEWEKTSGRSPRTGRETKGN